MSNRKSLKAEVIRRLLARSGNSCAFEGCVAPIYNDDDVYLGNFCHINAVNVGGKRYDSALSGEYINSYENLILLCPVHHKEIDTLDKVYTPERLKQIKANHESAFLENRIVSEDLVVNTAIEYDKVLTELLKNIQTTVEATNRTVNASDQKLEQLLGMVSKIKVGEEDTDLSEQLADLKDLKKAGKHKAVIELLLKYKTKYWETTSAKFRYNIQLNIGLAYFDLQENDDASAFLVGLKDLPYETDTKDSYVAIGYMLVNDFENGKYFAKKALEKKPKDINAYIVLLECGVVTEADIPAELLENTELRITLARHHEKRNEHKAATAIYEKLVEEATDPEMKNTLRSLLSISLYSTIEQPEMMLLGQLTTEERSTVTRCLLLMDEALEYFKHTDLIQSKWYLVANKGLYQKLLGKRREAEQSFMYSLELKKDYFTYQHLIILHIPDKRILDFIAEARELSLTMEQQMQLLLMEAEWYLSDGQADVCRAKLIEAKGFLRGNDVTEEYFYTVYFDFLISQHDLETLRNELVSIEGHTCLSFINNFYSIQLLAGGDNVDAYQGLSAELIDQVQKGVVPLPNQMSIGKFYFMTEDYENAMLVYRCLANKNIFQQLSYDLIYCFYKTGRYKEAEEWLNGYINAGETDQRLIDGLGTIYAQSGRLDDSIQLLRSSLAKTENNFLSIKLASVLCEAALFEEAAEVISKIKHVENFNLDTQFSIINIYRLCGKIRQAYDLAYAIRRDHLHDGSVHNRFVAFFMDANALSEAENYPLAVGSDCYVLCKPLDNAESTAQAFVLTNDPKMQIEIDVDSVIGKLLMGKVMSDEIRLNGHRYQISSIMSKFTYAFQNSLDLLTTQYQKESGIIQFTHSPDATPEENLKPIFGMIDRHDERQRSLNEFYKSGKATLGMMALQSGENPIRFWHRATSEDIGIVWKSPHDNPFMVSRLLDEQKGVLIDIVALLPLYINESFPALDALVNEKYISASTLTVIDQEVDQLEKSRKLGGYLSVVKTEDGYTRYQVTVDDLQLRIDYLQRFRTELLKRVTVITPTLSDDFLGKKELDELVGQSFNDSILDAKEHGYILLSDDGTLRHLAMDDKGVVGFSNRMLLDYLQAKGIMDRHTWSRMVAKLVQHNYKGMPVTGEMIYECFDADGFRPGIFSERAVSTLVSEPNPTVKAVVAADFLQALFSNNLMDKRDTAAVWLLNKYFMLNTSLVSKRLLLKVIDERFRFLPNQKERLKQIIKQYQQIV